MAEIYIVGQVGLSLGGEELEDGRQEMDCIIIVIQGIVLIQPSEHLLSDGGVGVKLGFRYGRTQTARRHPREGIHNQVLGS